MSVGVNWLGLSRITSRNRGLGTLARATFVSQRTPYSAMEPRGGGTGPSESALSIAMGIHVISKDPG